MRSLRCQHSEGCANTTENTRSPVRVRTEHCRYKRPISDVLTALLPQLQHPCERPSVPRLPERHRDRLCRDGRWDRPPRILQEDGIVEDVRTSPDVFECKACDLLIRGRRATRRRLRPRVHHLPGREDQGPGHYHWVQLAHRGASGIRCAGHSDLRARQQLKRRPRTACLAALPSIRQPVADESPAPGSRGPRRPGAGRGR